MKPTRPNRTLRRGCECPYCHLNGCDQCVCHLAQTVPTEPQRRLRALTAAANRDKYEAPLWMELRERCRLEGLPLPTRNLRWHPTRHFVSEIGWPLPIGLLVEADGGTFATGGAQKAHAYGAGYHRDRVRDLEAMLLGYAVARLDPLLLRSGEGVEYVLRLLRKRAGDLQRERRAA